ncbi:MAG: hypothetical protein IMZ65_01600, partial [Planctomycetes bacterium]|nr:hypothetical protein [Planctomycetota bacterium]
MRRFPTLAIAVTIGLIAGCGAGKIREDRAAFDAGYKAFKAGQWLTAVDGVNRYLRSCPTSPTRGEIYYYRGESLVHLNRRK